MFSALQLLLDTHLKICIILELHMVAFKKANHPCPFGFFLVVFSVASTSMFFSSSCSQLRCEIIKEKGTSYTWLILNRMKRDVEIKYWSGLWTKE